jgi:hypothetical protein
MVMWNWRTDFILAHDYKETLFFYCSSLFLYACTHSIVYHYYNMWYFYKLVATAAA